MSASVTSAPERRESPGPAGPQSTSIAAIPFSATHSCYTITVMRRRVLKQIVLELRAIAFDDNSLAHRRSEIRAAG
jgi:hypothetical protein